MAVRLVLPTLVLAFATISAGQNYTAELTRLSELTSAKEFRQAIDGYKKLAADASSPAWLKAASHYEIAELYARSGERQSALGAMREAVRLGFDDCQSPLKSEHLGPVIGASDLNSLLRNIALPEADYREIVWLQAEVNNAEHDAKMMITENISRVDQQATVVPQSAIPTRETRSAGVLYWREQLRVMQAAQRNYVQQSDQERMVHAATMQVIGGSGNTSAMLQSATQAAARADARKRDTQRRAFTPLASGTNTIKPCSQAP
jgi:hypothetical protein